MYKKLRIRYLVGLSLDQPSWLGCVRTTPKWFNLKPGLDKKLLGGFSCQLHLFFFSISSSKIFYQSVRLLLDLSSWLGHVRTTHTWFNFKLELDKKLNQEVLRLIYIYIYKEKREVNQLQLKKRNIREVVHYKIDIFILKQNLYMYI